MRSSRPFLTASWKQLAMLNYRIDPDILLPLVPAGTELDTFRGTSYVSVVGFMFEGTRVCGVPIPFHRTFEEVNLRFYVARKSGTEIRRGVVFVKEIVPKHAIALTAKLLYGENYVSLPMKHSIEPAIEPSSVSYQWKYRGDWNRVWVEPEGSMLHLVPGSEAEFIAAHYWGYTARSRGVTSEYEVRHPPWRVRRVKNLELRCNVGSLYGEQFVQALSADPASAFLAEGSQIEVHLGSRLTTSEQRISKISLTKSPPRA